MSNKKQKNTTFSDIEYFTNKVSDLMLEKKALDIKIIDVRKITTLTDMFIICTSNSDAQSRAITNNVKNKSLALTRANLKNG